MSTYFIMSNQNILKRLKQRFSQKDDYDVEHTALTKRKTNSLGKNVRLRGYVKVHSAQDSLSDTETSTSTSTRTGYHVRVRGRVKSTNSSPAAARRTKSLVVASPKPPNKSIVATATTKLIQPPAYACCVNRVKIIDNCCGRTEHNIIYHQHHPIVGVSNAGDLAAAAITEQTVVDIGDSALVCHSATTPRFKASSSHCKRCCTCSKQKQLQTLPSRSKRQWQTVAEEKCIECEKEKEKAKKELFQKQKDFSLGEFKSKQQSSASAEHLVCTCGLNDIQDNMKNRALEKANSVDNSLCSGGIDDSEGKSIQDTEPSTSENTKAAKQAMLHKDETAAMLLDEPSYICATLPSKSAIARRDHSKDFVAIENSIASSLIVDKSNVTENIKDSSFSDDDSRWLGNGSSGYCTQSDDCTDTASSIISSSESQRSTATCSSVHGMSEQNVRICESYVKGLAKEANCGDGLIDQNSPQPPTSLNFKDSMESDILEKDTTPPPIPQRNYRTNSFYKQQQLELLSIPTNKDDEDSTNSVEMLVDISTDQKEVQAKVSPPLLTRRSEWPAPPPPLDIALLDEIDSTESSTDEPVKEQVSGDEPIHMTMEEVWLDAQSHGIPLQKPVQCDRTYSTPEQNPDPAPDCVRSSSVPDSVTTPPHNRIEREQKLFVDLSTKCTETNETQVCGASGDLPYNHPSSSMCDMTTNVCGGLCMVDGPVNVTANHNYHTMPAGMSSTGAGNVSVSGGDVPPMLPPKRRGRTIMAHGGASGCDDMPASNVTPGLLTDNADTLTQTTRDLLMLDDSNQLGDTDGDSSADFVDSLRKLKDCGWYWGPLSWVSADAKLANKPDGSFLVRDSSDDRYILSLSFRTQGKTHHTRIEHFKGTFSFYSQPKSHGAGTIIEFIEKAMEHSCNGKFLYFLRPPAQGLPPAPVQLLYPVSRFRLMQSLQHLCRFSILRCTRYDHIDFLPLPPKIKIYLKESQYYTEYLQDDQCMNTITGQVKGQYTASVAL